MCATFLDKDNSKMDFKVNTKMNAKKKSIDFFVVTLLPIEFNGFVPTEMSTMLPLTLCQTRSSFARDYSSFLPLADQWET